MTGWLVALIRSDLAPGDIAALTRVPGDGFVETAWRWGEFWREVGDGLIDVTRPADAGANGVPRPRLTGGRTADRAATAGVERRADPAGRAIASAVYAAEVAATALSRLDAAAIRRDWAAVAAEHNRAAGAIGETLHILARARAITPEGTP